MEFSNMQSQAMASNLDELVLINCPKSHQQQKQQEKNNKPASKPHPEQAIRCPRCDSTSTKFCYYNNYSLSQPRYLCKSCRRYWTQGGSLRNVPFGSSCRKTKRSSSSSAVATAETKSQDQHPNDLPGSLTLPPFSFDPNDLTLAFFSMQNHENFILPNPIPNPSHSGFLDILRSGLVDNPSESAPSMYCDGFGENATDVGGDRLTVFPSDESSWQNGLMNPHVGGLHIEDF